uniref:Uncharacterized protein n=1 Tax=Panagrolaimus sp. ES5 TaxID=591445 RepID=A0AC34FZC6_9BILA
MSYPVCHNLELRKMFHENCIKSNYTEFNGNSASICYNPPTESEFVFGRQFIISNKFDFQCSKLITLSTFLPNIFQCNAKFLKISSQNITLKELVFLVGHKNVEKLLLSECKIANDKNEDVDLSEILALTPKIIEFE